MSRVDLVPDGVKRQYRSPSREAAAAETAERIRAAAAELFLAQGYAATTLRQVAERAGVGERTLYDAYGDKRRVLSRTISHLAMGETDRTRLADRPEYVAAREHADPRVAVAETMALQAVLADRAAELILVAEEAARADPAMREQARKGSEMGYEVFARLGASLEERGALRDGLDGGTAADTMFVFATPQTYEVLRRRRRWSFDRYRDWMIESAQLQVLPAQNAEEKTSR